MSPAEPPVDVTVVGGGSAGVTAALASSRAGARTVLLEAGPELGGQGAGALVHTFCGLYSPDSSSYANPGIPVEIAEAMLQRTAQPAPERLGHVSVLHQEPAIYSQLLAELCAAEEQLHVFLHSPLDTVALGYRINGELRTRCIVDTTGNALVAQALGAPTQSSPECLQQRPAQIAEIRGLQRRLSDQDRLQVAALLVKAVRDRLLPGSALGAHFRNAASGGKRAFLTLDGASIVREIHAFLAAHHDAFAGSEISPAKDRGQRESVRWLGDTTLKESDLLAARRFPDDIALATWPVETRYTANGPKLKYLPAPAGIPLRALTNRRFPGIYAAGRCLSADPGAHASVRVIGTALATGQAAGREAAHFARSRCR